MFPGILTDMELWGEPRKYHHPSLAWQDLCDAADTVQEGWKSDRYHDAVRMESLWNTEAGGGAAPGWWWIARENGTHLFESALAFRDVVTGLLRVSTAHLVVARCVVHGATDRGRQLHKDGVRGIRPDQDKPLTWVIYYATIGPDGAWKPGYPISSKGDL